MTSEEMVSSLHMRMKILRRKQEQRTTAALGGVCGLLAAGLALVLAGHGVYTGTADCLYTGSAMLFEGAGGYVLTAVIAFMVGVVITVIIKWNLEKKKQGTHDNQAKHETVSFLEDDTLLQAAGGKKPDRAEQTGENKTHNNNK